MINIKFRFSIQMKLLNTEEEVRYVPGAMAFRQFFAKIARADGRIVWSFPHRELGSSGLVD
jgi:hypothetical protein